MNIDRVVKAVSFYIYIFAAVASISLAVYYAGYHEGYLHNLDLVFNVVKDDAILNNAIDWYAVGQSIPLRDSWIMSLNFLRGMPLRFLGLGFIVGLCFASMIFLFEEANDHEQRREGEKDFDGKPRHPGKRKRKW